ncbi:MAG: diaminopimelate decarboxylase [Deltaproteobacteria bacterium]|nr:diaminopimelate decarboxylase [Deltaproteobacteria bacterium]
MSKPRYERPVLIRHEAGLMNKFGRVQALRPLTEIDGAAVDELVAAYGSPLFVFSERTLVERARELKEAFARRWPRVRLAWSYKTNYLGGICRIFHREGAFAEVVSDFEYDKALGLGVPPDHIHWNGPYKTDAALTRALAGGAIVHLDHFDELAAAERIAERLDLRPSVALRISLSVEGVPEWSRFGFHLESGQARDAVARLVAGNRLELVGLHCHLGTFIADVRAYGEQARKLARLANEIRERHGVRLGFIDIGGGFASHNTLKEQYLPGTQATPPFSRYAEAVIEGLCELTCPAREQPLLVLETGRALVDDAGTLIATVHANKRLPDGRRGVVLDAGVNVLFTAFWYRHDVVPCQETHGTPEPTVLFGPLCMNIDVIRDSLLLPPLQVGDRIALRNCGAYNVTQWMQFITYRPAVVLVGDGGRHALLRRCETLDDVVGPEQTPPWL